MADIAQGEGGEDPWREHRRLFSLALHGMVDDVRVWLWTHPTARVEALAEEAMKREAVDEESAQEQSVLAAAVKMGHKRVVKALLDDGRVLRDSKDVAALALAEVVEAQDAETLDALLKAGVPAGAAFNAAVTARRRYQHNHAASDHPKLDACMLLLMAQPDLDVMGPVRHHTALHAALEMGDVEVLRFMLSKPIPADRLRVTRVGEWSTIPYLNTALNCCAPPEAIELLVNDERFDLYEMDVADQSALTVACERYPTAPRNLDLLLACPRFDANHLSSYPLRPEFHQCRGTPAAAVERVLTTCPVNVHELDSEGVPLLPKMYFPLNRDLPQWLPLDTLSLFLARDARVDIVVRAIGSQPQPTLFTPLQIALRHFCPYPFTSMDCIAATTVERYGEPGYWAPQPPPRHRARGGGAGLDDNADDEDGDGHMNVGGGARHRGGGVIRTPVLKAIGMHNVPERPAELPAVPPVLAAVQAVVMMNQFAPFGGMVGGVNPFAPSGGAAGGVNPFAPSGGAAGDESLRSPCKPVAPRVSPFAIDSTPTTQAQGPVGPRFLAQAADFRRLAPLYCMDDPEVKAAVQETEEEKAKAEAQAPAIRGFQFSEGGYHVTDSVTRRSRRVVEMGNLTTLASGRTDAASRPEPHVYRFLHLVLGSLVAFAEGCDEQQAMILWRLVWGSVFNGAWQRRRAAVVARGDQGCKA